MYEVGTMKVLQTLSRSVQLLSNLQHREHRKTGETYQFQPVDVIEFDILHDVPVHHPFRHGNELPLSQVPINPSEL